MLGISLGEVLVILFFALLAFGPKQIPKVARTLGRMVREMKRISWEVRRALAELEREVEKNVPTDEIADLAPKKPPTSLKELGKELLEKGPPEENRGAGEVEKEKDGSDAGKQNG